MTAPERIWTQREFHETCVRGSACTHETVRHAVEYVRADVHAAALVAKDAEISRLRESLTSVADYMPEETDHPLMVIVRMAGLARAALNTQHKGETT